MAAAWRYKAETKPKEGRPGCSLEDAASSSGFHVEVTGWDRGGRVGVGVIWSRFGLVCTPFYEFCDFF